MMTAPVNHHPGLLKESVASCMGAQTNRRTATICYQPVASLVVVAKGLEEGADHDINMAQGSMVGMMKEMLKDRLRQL